MKPNGDQVAKAAVSTVLAGHTYDEMDCQAFVEYSVKQAGGAMNYRGSNDMARNAEWLGTLDEAKSKGYLIPGALLFIREEDEDNLPDRYAGDRLGDYSHVGIYLGDNNSFSDLDKNGIRRTCNVAHSSSTMRRAAGSTLQNGWTHVGLAKEIDYSVTIEDEPEVIEPNTPDTETDECVNNSGLTSGSTSSGTRYAKVTSSNGYPVKLRKSPSTNENVYWKVNNGARVIVEREVSEWSLIQAICTDGITRRAYMMSKFLKLEE